MFEWVLNVLLRLMATNFTKKKKVIFQKIWSSLTEKLVILIYVRGTPLCYHIARTRHLISVLRVNCLTLFYVAQNLFFCFCFCKLFCNWLFLGYFSLSRVLTQFSQLFRLSRMTCVYWIMHSKVSCWW